MIRKRLVRIEMELIQSEISTSEVRLVVMALVICNF